MRNSLKVPIEDLLKQHTESTPGKALRIWQNDKKVLAIPALRSLYHNESITGYAHSVKLPTKFNNETCWTIGDYRTKDIKLRLTDADLGESIVEDTIGTLITAAKLHDNPDCNKIILGNMCLLLRLATQPDPSFLQCCH